jgi:hypothetical protein
MLKTSEAGFKHYWFYFNIEFSSFILIAFSNPTSLSIFVQNVSFMYKKVENYFALLIIFILGFTFHFKYINEFPSNIHAWAQADRYALALGFTKNNLNFFKPQTFILNPQFPYNGKVPMKESITAVDFPIHDYIPAVIMKITGNNSPWIFRLYILLYSFLGLFYLYKLTYLLTNSFYKSIFVLIFTATLCFPPLLGQVKVINKLINNNDDVNCC